jgi:hypothetical protein
MLRWVIILSAVAVLAVPARAQVGMGAKKESGDSCLMYGPDHLFAIKAPLDWAVDIATAQQLGLHAVMYPRGSSWREAPATMYTNFIHKDKNLPSLEKIIANDIDSYRKESPNIVIEDGEKLPIADGKEQIAVKRFHGDRGGNYEAVATLTKVRSLF